jgi:hypothetical protein
MKYNRFKIKNRNPLTKKPIKILRNHNRFLHKFNSADLK